MAVVVQLFVVILVGACATESADDHLAIAQDRHEIDCGTARVADDCFATATAHLSLQCMSQALTTGARARFTTHSLTFSTFEMESYLFTVDGAVERFVRYPDGDDAHGPYTEELAACAGPFHLEEYFCVFSEVTSAALIVDGCPL